MLIEDFKKETNSTLKEIQENMAKQKEGLKEEAQKSLKESQENTGKQVKAIKEETQKSLKELKKNRTKRVMELEKKNPRFNKRSINNKENPKGENSRDRNPRKQIWNHKCEHQQQKTKDGRENLKCRRFHREHGNSTQRK